MNPRLIIACLLCALPVAWTGCGEKKAESAAPPPPTTVKVITVQPQDLSIVRDSVATLQGSITTEVRPRVSGYLLEQAYPDGQLVKEGDLLFRIDPAPYEIAVQQAEATAAEARANLIKTQLEVERDEELIKANAVSQKQLDNARQAEDAARAQLEAALAAVANAKLNLSYCTVKAPIDGVAAKAFVNLGDLVGPSDALTEISTLDPIQAVFTIPEQAYLANAEDILEIMQKPLEERKAALELILVNGKTFPKKGKFQYVDLNVGTGTGAVRLFALFPNPRSVLRPGQFARIRAKVGELEDTIAVPQRALMEMQNTFSVFVVSEDNTVKEVSIERGQDIGSQAVITSGLKAGDTVVVEGLQRVKDGAKVDPQPWQPSDPSKEPPSS